MNLLMGGLVRDLWSRPTLYVVPEGSETSWVRTLLVTSPEEVCAALEGQTYIEGQRKGPALGLLPPRYAPHGSQVCIGLRLLKVVFSFLCQR